MWHNKSRARNCMIGWMLGVTAVIILALAIALFVQGLCYFSTLLLNRYFVQVARDADELDKLKSTFNNELQSLSEQENALANLDPQALLRAAGAVQPLN